MDTTVNFHNNYNDIPNDNINSIILFCFLTFIQNYYDYRTKRDKPIPLKYLCYFCKSEKFQYMYKEALTNVEISNIKQIHQNTDK